MRKALLVTMLSLNPFSYSNNPGGNQVIAVVPPPPLYVDDIDVIPVVSDDEKERDNEERLSYSRWDKIRRTLLCLPCYGNPELQARARDRFKLLHDVQAVESKVAWTGCGFGGMLSCFTGFVCCACGNVKCGALLCCAGASMEATSCTAVSQMIYHHAALREIAQEKQISKK